MRAQAPAAPAQVWVNTRSGVYHCPGTEYYGKTTQGEYLPETEARQRGFRANGGRACGPLTTTDSGATVATTAPRGFLGATVPDSAPAAPVPPTQPCVVTKITDGDTIACEGLGNVRLIGVDAPEKDQEPFGTAATAGLASLVALGSTIQLEKDAVERDSRGRLLAYLWSEGRQINWLLVRQGWAVALPYNTTRRYEQAFAAAERRAEAESRGLWQVDGFRCRPADKRANRCQ
jgi:endonuclease YncB( thermonuclease family)